MDVGALATGTGSELAIFGPELALPSSLLALLFPLPNRSSVLHLSLARHYDVYVLGGVPLR